MMLKLKIKLTALFLVCVVSLQAQTKQYRYKRNLKGITTNWHSIALPNDIFKNAQSGLEDLRLFGIKGKDTLEVPYILEQNTDQVTERETAFNLINQSTHETGYYYTFQTLKPTLLNQIKLSFKQSNFDWKVKLEGSNDNKTWFTLLKNYRILAIQNSNTAYHFADLNFPQAKFSYFRVIVNANEQPQLSAAKILQVDTLKRIYKTINYKNYTLTNDQKNKQSIIHIDLNNITPVSYLKLNVQSDFDFYRTLKIEYATDSFKTDKGYQYQYNSLYNGTISSLEVPEFKFASTLLSRLRITVYNNDNRPLSFSNINLKGPIYKLVGRFEDTSLNYAVYYGNKESTMPAYELKNFEDKIPLSVTAISIGEEQLNPSFNIKEKTNPLFENKAWLWSLMAVIIALLGYFAFRMLKD